MGPRPERDRCHNPLVYGLCDILTTDKRHILVPIHKPLLIDSKRHQQDEKDIFGKLTIKTIGSHSRATSIKYSVTAEYHRVIPAASQNRTMAGPLNF